jgi:hypothetical protein
VVDLLIFSFKHNRIVAQMARLNRCLHAGTVLELIVSFEWLEIAASSSSSGSGSGSGKTRLRDRLRSKL